MIDPSFIRYDVCCVNRGWGEQRKRHLTQADLYKKQEGQGTPHEQRRGVDGAWLKGRHSGCNEDSAAHRIVFAIYQIYRREVSAGYEKDVNIIHASWQIWKQPETKPTQKFSGSSNIWRTTRFPATEGRTDVRLIHTNTNPKKGSKSRKEFEFITITDRSSHGAHIHSLFGNL